MRFRELYIKHGDENERNGAIITAKNSEQIRQVEIGDDEDRAEVEADIKAKMLQLAG